MNRRLFLSSSLTLGSALLIGQESIANPESAVCVPGLDFVSAEATYFKAYEHYHLLSIPVTTLITLPEAGFTTRTSILDQGSLDVEAIEKFLKETGLSASLKTHSHEVKFTQAELQRIASGEKEVEITVLTPKGNLAHRFYFTASPSALAKIRRARGA